MPSRLLYLAVDGGASSTRAVLGTQSGTILGVGRAGPSNHAAGAIGRKRLREALRESILGAVHSASLEGQTIEHAWLGMTGYLAQTQAKKLISKYTHQIVPVVRVSISSDMETAHAGASALQASVLVYAGTGSFAFARDTDGHTGRCGGWGHIIDDEGGGYQLGRAALKAAFRAHDGRGPETQLYHAILGHFNAANLNELLPLIYYAKGSERSTIAALARVVSSVAAQGDDVARTMLKHAGQELGELGVASARAFPGLADTPLIHFAGGTFRAPEPLPTEFKRTVLRSINGARFSQARLPPVLGGYLLALASSGTDIDDTLTQELGASFKAAGGTEQE